MEVGEIWRFYNDTGGYKDLIVQHVSGDFLTAEVSQSVDDTAEVGESQTFNVTLFEHEKLLNADGTRAYLLPGDKDWEE